MTNDLVWFELSPPRNLNLAAMAALVRPLASRPHLGFMQRTPVVIFETRLTAGHVRWFCALDHHLATSVPHQFRAQLPGLDISPSSAANRPQPSLATDVRLSSPAFPLRLDTAESVSAGVLGAASLLHGDEALVMQWVVGPSYQRSTQPSAFHLDEALGFRKPTPPSAAETQAWRQKSSEPLFGARGRIGAAAATSERVSILIRAIVGALSLANSSHCAIRTTLHTAKRADDLVFLRQPALHWSAVVSSSELGVLLGFPLGDRTVPGQASRLGRVPSRLLLPHGADAGARRPDRVLGASLHPADQGRLVTMPVASAGHHLFATGPTGSGKSNELAQMALSDITAGYGSIVIEPRGDLINDILLRLPVHRQADVVVIDPSDDDQVGFNPLAGPREQAEQRADELVGLFRALFGTAIGPRSADVLFHALLTAARLPDGTLADVPILLAADSVFRRQALAKVGDPLVLDRWWAWFDSLSAGEQQQITAPLNNKLRAFLARQPIRRMLSQPHPKFSLDECFQVRPRVVLVNLNAGVIGPEATRLLGALWLSAGWAAAQRRAILPRSQRFPVMLVVDEFADYVGSLDFGELLAKSRGLGMSITAAAQNLAQLSPHLRAAVTANARSRLSFRPSQDDAAPLAAVFGEPVTPDDLLRLGAFQVCARLLVDSAMTAPFAVQTLPLGAPTTDAAALRQRSREHYATSGRDLDAALVQRWRGEDSPPPPGSGGLQRRRP